MKDGPGTLGDINWCGDFEDLVTLVPLLFIFTIYIMISRMDKGNRTAVILLDLPVAFDTVDHNRLHLCLEQWISLSGPAL